MATHAQQRVQDIRSTLFVGQGYRRKEDRRLTTGVARFIADVKRPNALHVAFVRSPYAHARIKQINSSPALALDGVIAAYSGQDLLPRAKPIRATFAGTNYIETDYPVLAIDTVRFAGEPVVAVVATNRYLAEDGADAILIEYEELPPVVTIEDGLSPDAPQVHSGVPGNLVIDERNEFGRVDDERGRAAVEVEATFRTQRSAAAPLECRGALAEYDPGSNRLTLWTSTQIPHVVRFGLAHSLGLDEQQVHILSPDVGGGFGNKASLDPEQVVVSALARELGRPVVWIEDRRENLLASTHAQEERIRLRLSADADGRFRTLEADIVLNAGAYAIFPDTPGNELLNCAACIVGPYKIEHYRYRARAVATTTCPHGPYRGVARPPANFALERLVDMLARRLSMDPADVHRVNLLRHADMPYTTVTGLVRDSGDYVRSLELALDELGYETFKRQKAGYRSEGRLLGAGFACFAEECAVGTGRRTKRQIHAIAGYDSATIRVDAQGRALVFSSCASSGQGHETMLAQLAADELGVDPEQIQVRQNDTELAPYGMGSTGSRTTVSSGGAVILAARKLRQRLLALGAFHLNEPLDNVSLDQRGVYSLSEPGRAVPVARLARIAHRREGTVPDGFELGLEATAAYDPPPLGVSSYSTHAALVEIDRRTGRVEILRYVVVEDTGRMVNPVLVEGQIKGGVAQGIGKALFEDVIYDAAGQLANASFMDFLLPSAQEMCNVDLIHMETPSPLTEGGMKGCGESGLIGTPAAVGNAIVDALDGAVEVLELPFTPEKVYRLIRTSGIAEPGPRR